MFIYLYIFGYAAISGMSLSAYVRFTTTIVPDLESANIITNIESLYENDSGYCRLVNRTND